MGGLLGMADFIESVPRMHASDVHFPADLNHIACICFDHCNQLVSR